MFPVLGSERREDDGVAVRLIQRACEVACGGHDEPIRQLARTRELSVVPWLSVSG